MRKRSRGNNSSVDDGSDDSPSRKGMRRSTTTSSREADSNGNREGVMIGSNTVLGGLLTQCGYILMMNNSPNQLKVDQVVFRRDLETVLTKHSDYPKVLDEFMDELLVYLDEPDHLKHSLFPTETSPDCDESSRGGSQESFMKLLLGVETVQLPVAKMLLHKLPEFTSDNRLLIHNNMSINVPRLIINQFRWLDRINNCQEVCDTMLEVVSVVDVDIQRDIISCLPDVIDDVRHNSVADQLRVLMRDNPDLTVSILDSLSNLTISDSLLTDIRTAVNLTLRSAPLTDLPIIIKFLLQSLTNQDATQVITEIRDNLDFMSSFPPVLSSTPRPSNTSRIHHGNENSSEESLILESLKCSIRFQKVVSDSWLKLIDSIVCPDHHKVIDVFVLLILHSSTSVTRKKQIETLFRNKVRHGHISEELIIATLTSHQSVMKEYFGSMLCLAELLLRSPDLSVCVFGSVIYKHMFLTSDPYCRQEIVGVLVTHIGSGVSSEIDSSLSILTDLVDTHPDQMAPFAVFIKGIFEYLDNFSMRQIRQLFHMLTALAYGRYQEEAGVHDDVNIVVRKQLNNDNTRYKQIGVVTGLMIMNSMASSITTMEGEEGTTLPSDTMNKVMALLGLIHTSIGKCGKTMSLFHDELANIVDSNSLHREVQEVIGATVLTDFQESYIVDVDGLSLQTRETTVPGELMFSLEESMAGGIALDLLTIMDAADTVKLGTGLDTDPDNTVRNVISPRCIATHFRLLRCCEYSLHQGDLDGIDGLLGCSVFYAKSETLQNFSTLSHCQKEFLLNSLFYTVNWFIEVVNGFCRLPNPRMLYKVLKRLKDITEIKNIINKIYPEMTNYEPPPAHFDVGETKPLSTVPSHGVNSTQTSKKSNKKSVKQKTGTDGLIQQTLLNVSTVSVLDRTQTQTQASSDKDPVCGTCPDLQPYYREFDVDVFTLLSYPLSMTSDLSEDIDPPSPPKLNIDPSQLELLLKDLCRKLEHSLIASCQKRKIFLKVKSPIGFTHLDLTSPSDVAKTCETLLPYICNHGDSCIAHFTSILAQNDGVLDGPNMTSSNSVVVASCLHLVLQILHHYFSWNGFVYREHKALLSSSLQLLASRLKSTDYSSSPHNTTQLPAKEVYLYLESISTPLPNIQCAATMVKLLITVNHHSSTSLSNSISELCKSYLIRDWYCPSGLKEKGAKFNEYLHTILECYISLSDQCMTVISDIIQSVCIQLSTESTDNTDHTYNTLSKSTLGVYYKVMCIQLVNNVKHIPNPNKQLTIEECLDVMCQWNVAIKNFHALVNLIKQFDARANVIVLLKNGRVFVEVFLAKAMPVLDKLFKTNKTEVQGLLRNFQLCTRYLQHLCSHSKVMKDITMTNHVPAMKKCLESLVYRVKAMLILNKAEEAFWLGNLKNRNLKGEEILSQESRADTTNDDAGQSEDPDEVLDGLNGDVDNNSEDGHVVLPLLDIDSDDD